jgi:beta-glucanase (GH16 family)
MNTAGKRKTEHKEERITMLMIFSALLLIQFTTGCSKNDAAPTSVIPSDSVAQLPGWTLVWNDEFNGTSIDLNKWNYEVNGDGGGNNELQYYTARPQNSSIENGALVIRAQQENYLSKQYTSARMNSNLKGDWKYGHVEARAKLPIGKGMWPAIWMLPTDWEYGGWPMSGEIDIMECLGQEPQKVYGTIHFGQSVATQQQMGGSMSLTSGTFNDDFHVFAIDWDSTSIQWYVDGKKYFTAVKSFPFDKRFHLVLNVAVGGNWPGSPDEFTTFPQTMVIDYIRVYEKQ